MVKINSIDELESLPKTKWNISQPADNDIREDALTTGILLIALNSLNNKINIFSVSFWQSRRFRFDNSTRLRVHR